MCNSFKTVEVSSSFCITIVPIVGLFFVFSYVADFIALLYTSRDLCSLFHWFN